MNYNPFSFMGSSSQDPTRRGGILGELPSQMSWRTTQDPFNPIQKSFRYGMAGLDPNAAYEAQKREFGRLGELQSLQTGALQQQQAGLQLRQSQMEMADLEEQRRIREIIDKGPPMTSGPASPYGSSWNYAINSPYGKRYQLEKEKTQYELDMMRRMGQGGFGSWSVPSFPSMG